MPQTKESWNELLNWRTQLAEHWSGLRFGPATLEEKEGQPVFQVQVFLDDLDPNAVSVESTRKGRTVTHLRAIP